VPAASGWSPTTVSIPGVAAASHFTWFNGIYKNEPKNFFGSFPVEPEPFLAMFPEYTLPEEQKQTWLKTRTGAIVGRSLASRKEFNWKIGDHIQLASPIWPRKGEGAWEFEIVGIYDGAKKGTDTSGFYFRYDYFDEARAGAKGQVGWYTIRVKDPARAAEIAKLVDQEFENSAAETKTEPEGAFVQGWAKQVGNIAFMIAAILGAVFFTILLVTGNTMAQAVRERTGELGVLKAIGFTNARIVSLVLAESCLLTVLGGVLGLALAFLVVPVLAKGLAGMLPMFNFPTRDLFIGLGISVALGLITGILPALQAMRLRVADALRRM
jgi:putative ABC transport system permease protein